MVQLLHEQGFVLSNRWDGVLTGDVTAPEAAESPSHSAASALSSARTPPAQQDPVYHNQGVRVSVFVITHEWICKHLRMQVAEVTE